MQCHETRSATSQACSRFIHSWIYSALPESKQTLALSATYPEALADFLKQYMFQPQFVRLNSSDPSLLGEKCF